MAENSTEKLRGGYYTPAEVSDFIVNWAVTSPGLNTLEPSCGDGNFIKSLVNRYNSLNANSNDILGIELYEEEAQKAMQYGVPIITSDFFSYYQNNIEGKKCFDVVVGNPPFIRYQNFQEEYRKCAFSLASSHGISLNRLTNIWIPFLILSAECLSPAGRLGMVIPAELFQVDYAAETRQYLTKKFEHITIITFKKLLFEGTQQEVVLLLCEKISTRKGIDVYELDDSAELKNFQPKNITAVKALDHTTEKWTKYYLSNTELALLKKLETSGKLSSTTDLFEVNVGVVSGQNKFFVVDKSTSDVYELHKYLRPIIGRSEQLKGIQLSAMDFNNLVDAGKKVYLFTPDDIEKEDLPDSIKSYIQWGESEGFHKGFKCRNRKRWYIVPQSWSPQAFMLRQINKTPRIVLNSTQATNTDTLHKIRFLEGIDPYLVTAAFINSFTFAQCEVTGRSYGGGVMSFEPNEVRKLQIPMIGAEHLNFQYVDKCIRENNIEAALNYVDAITLIDGCGLTWDEVYTLRGIWEKLSDRRLGRKEDNSTK